MLWKFVQTENNYDICILLAFVTFEIISIHGSFDDSYQCVNHHLMCLPLCNVHSFSRIHSALRVQKQLTTNRPQSVEAQRKELNMALVLICIVVLFILCQSVKIVPDVYEALVCRRQKVGSQG